MCSSHGSALIHLWNYAAKRISRMRNNFIYTMRTSLTVNVPNLPFQNKPQQNLISKENKSIYIA